MDWSFLIIVLALVGCIFWYFKRRFIERWNKLEQLIEDLSKGEKVSNFLFRGSPRFTRLALKVEKLAEEQQRLKKQISEEEFNLQAILFSMEEAVMVVNQQHVIQLVNNAFLKLFNLKAKPSQQTILDVLREASVEELTRTTFQTGEPQSGEISLIQQSSTRHLAISAVPIQDSNKRAIGVVTVFHDISRLKQLEDVRRQFVANVSHELRTPLSIFHGYVENLLDNPKLPQKELVGILEIMEKHSLRLNALLEDLLTLARLESRHEKIEPVSINLEPFLIQLTKYWSRKTDQKKITILLNISPEMPPVSADAFRMEQVFNNLFENAIKYTEGQGEIIVSAEATAQHIKIRVEDNGIGIPQSDLPHIFERFYCVNKARDSKSKGRSTGLGLSIVKHIVQLHGGTVHAESEFGKGTAITILLPRLVIEDSLSK